MTCVVFVKAIFSCLNLKSDDGFLLYNMLEVFNKTEYGLTNIIIACDEFKSVLHREYQYIHLLCAKVQLKALHHGWGLCKKFFQYFSVTTLSKK